LSIPLGSEVDVQPSRQIKSARAQAIGVAMTEKSKQSDWSDDEVRSFRAWCETCGISPETGRRIIKSGQGPLITHLSDRRIGVRGRHHRHWLDKCAGITAENSDS
jgi:hypothetical protein